MQKAKLTKAIILTMFCMATTMQATFAEDSTINVPLQQGSVQSSTVIHLSKQHGAQPDTTYVKLSESDAFYHLVNASDRFVQCNIRAAWSDFRNLINSVADNDFVYLSTAQKRSEERRVGKECRSRWSPYH